MRELPSQADGECRVLVSVGGGAGTALYLLYVTFDGDAPHGGDWGRKAGGDGPPMGAGGAGLSGGRH